MYYDILITLKKPSEPILDKVGNEIPTFSENQAWCGELSVTQSEFYSAASRQFKPEKVLELWDRDYTGETHCVLNGVEYEIYRTFRKSESTKRELYLRVTQGGN